MENIIVVVLIAIIVLFQNEIRSIFYSVSSRMERGLTWGKARKYQNAKHLVNELELALRHMSDTKTGALIVITGKLDLSEYVDSGELLDATISSRLIESIFFKNTPLHDGALFVTNGRLRAAACILPVSANKDLPNQYGLRHRAALGLTEKTDATALVVSEETGHIAIAEGNTIRVVSPEELTSVLVRLFV